MRHDGKSRSGPDGTGPKHDATDVRQGEIILRTPMRRAIFFGGLIGIVLLPFLLWLLS